VVARAAKDNVNGRDPITRGFRSRWQQQTPKGRVPPGQNAATYFPVLTAGQRPFLEDREMGVGGCNSWTTISRGPWPSRTTCSFYAPARSITAEAILNILGAGRFHTVEGPVKGQPTSLIRPLRRFAAMPQYVRNPG
jgi:hypothetical protein